MGSTELKSSTRFPEILLTLLNSAQHSLGIQVNGNHSRPEVKALFHNLENLLVWNLSSGMRVNKYG